MGRRKAGKQIRTTEVVGPAFCGLRLDPRAGAAISENFLMGHSPHFNPGVFSY
jgi:hypothetical protein